MPARVLALTAVCGWLLAILFGVVAFMLPTARVGDPGSVLVSSKLDPRFHDMPEWANAGVQGGIPFRDQQRIVQTIAPDSDIQAALDSAAEAGGGVVLLAPGKYRWPQDRLEMRSCVVLRGHKKEKCVLEVTKRPSERLEWDIVGVLFSQVEWAGLEDLTILHPDVAAMDPKAYRGYGNDQAGITNLHIGHVYVRLSRNCWIDNCRLLYAGTDPIILWDSEHITLRDNLVRDSFNKGGGRNGYYLVRGSSHVLCYNETVQGLRHFAIQNKSKYCVVLNCYLETDLNFHGLDKGHNLVEGCLIKLPGHHHWRPIGNYKYERGESNLLYKVEAYARGGSRTYCSYRDPRTGKKIGVPYDPEAVFAVNPRNDGLGLVKRLEGKPPAANTLYAMTGSRRSAQALRKLYGRVGMNDSKPGRKAQQKKPKNTPAQNKRRNQQKKRNAAG